MKCKNCGAPLTMTQRFCSNCGAPNEQSNQHIADMDRYQKEFSSTRKEVIGNSKWFLKYITPFTVLAVSIIVSAIFLIGKESMWGYDMADRHQANYNKTHKEEITANLNRLMEENRYYSVYELRNNNDQTLSASTYQSDWRDFYNLSGTYSDLRKYIMVYYDAELTDSTYYDSNMNRAASTIVEIEETLSGKSYSAGRAPETEKPIAYMVNAYHTFLQVYCNFTEADIRGLEEQDQNSVLALLMRRMQGETKK